MRIVLYYMSLLAFVVACNQDGCQGVQDLAANIQDSDSDGWMDSTTNLQIDLFIDVIDLDIGANPLSLIVDDQILIDDADPEVPTGVVTSRNAGQWHVGNLLQYEAQIKIFISGDTEGAATRTLPFNNRDSVYQIAYNLGGDNVAMQYRTEVTSFADPSPADPNGDLDDDGITDGEEAFLAQSDARVGDPNKRDILICVAHTADQWKLMDRTIERITTVFIDNGFNILFADEETDLSGLSPGQILFEDANGNLSVPAVNRAVSLSEVAPLRPRHISDTLDPFTHLLVVADNTPDAGFGVANLPGLNSVIRSHFFALGPYPLGLEYQAIDAMHELGHNFGLCHPNQSDTTCFSGAIPQSERNGASSSMGSPADDGGLFIGILPNIPAITNAFSRPLDYSPTQWSNIDVASSRNN